MMSRNASDMFCITCGKCGCEFWIPTEMQEHLRTHGETFYCPNGHPRAYQKTTIHERDEARRERDLAKQQLARVEEELQQAKAAGLALKARVVGGKCPCCKHSFTRLSAHLKRRHPAYVKNAALS